MSKRKKSETTAPIIERCQSAHPVLVVLVGLSGCGKSTVAQRLVEGVGAVRVSQDVLKTPAKVGLAATEALANGARCVVVDRTNLGRKHRAELLGIAKEAEAESIALVLNYGKGISKQRCSERVGHEGGVVGAKHLRFQHLQPVEADEGFGRVLVCQTDQECSERVAELEAELRDDDRRKRTRHSVSDGSVQIGTART